MSNDRLLRGPVLVLTVLPALGGCSTAVAVVDTTVGVTTTVVGTAVDVTAAGVEGAVDLVTDDDEDGGS